MISIIPFARYSGKYNMDLDIDLFNELEKGSKGPLLRLYGWKKPCISLGYSQDNKEELLQENCAKNGIEVIKRPTGGGIVFHNEHEITYSLICDIDDPKLSKGMVESYRAISKYVLEALNRTGVPAKMSDTRQHSQARLCFSFPASYEITLKGHKIVGSAQKRGKKALLQQGSIFMRNNDLKASDFIKNGQDFKSIEDIMGNKPNDNALIHALMSAFITF